MRTLQWFLYLAAVSVEVNPYLPLPATHCPQRVGTFVKGGSVSAETGDDAVTRRRNSRLQLLHQCGQILNHRPYLGRDFHVPRLHHHQHANHPARSFKAAPEDLFLGAFWERFDDVTARHPRTLTLTKTLRHGPRRDALRAT